MNKFTKLIGGLFNRKAANPGTRLAFLNGNVVWFKDNPHEFVDKGYQANDIIYSAVTLVTDKARLAPWSLYKVVDEPMLKNYKSHLAAGNLTAAANLHHKALVPLTNYNLRQGKWNELTKWVNEYETFSDFVANGITYKMLTGNKFWWANLLEAGANQGIPQELYALPSQYMTVIAKQGWPVKSVGYQLNSGEIISFGKEVILHEKYFNPEYDYLGSHLYGQSPLKAAMRNLTRNNYAKTATTAKFENGGMEGVLFVNDQRVHPEDGLTQAKEVKKVLYSKEYAGAANAGKIGVAGYPMGFISLAQTTKELMALDFEDLDLRRLCNIWGIPSQLMNDPNNKTYNNQIEGEKALTSRCVVPQLSATRDNMNRKLQNDWGLKGENVYLDYDISVFTELQEDQSKKWQWVSQLTVPEAYKLEMMGLDVPPELPKDLILIDGNKQTLDELINQVNMTDITNQLANAGINDYGNGQQPNG